LNIKTYNKYSIITIINWYQYQTDEQQMNNRRTSNEHKQELKEELKEETPNFFSLKNRYSDPDLIEKVFQAIASTRKSNKVADSVLLAQLQKWERYPAEQVESGIRIYLDKDCAGQGKDEKYLWGIIRKQKSFNNNQPTAEPPPVLTIDEIEEMNREN
jgi:predicted house-cleaning noncanonical NTP pyrophosphatase (MazG superfamily)